MFQIRDYAIGNIKYTGRSKGIVVDNRDPQKKGRVRVNHPIVGKTVWIPYLKTPSAYSVPKIGDLVYVECEAGFATHPIAWGQITKEKKGKPLIAEAFQRIEPTNQGIITPNSNAIELDDGLQSLSGVTKSGIKLTTAQNNALHLRDSEAFIALQSLNNDLLKINTENNKTSLHSTGAIRFDSKEEKVETVEGDWVLDTQSQLLSKSVDKTQLDGGGARLRLESNKAALGNDSVELLDIVDKFQAETIALSGEASKLAGEINTFATSASTETHPTSVGPTGPPTNAADYTQVATNAATIQSAIDTIKSNIESLKSELGQLLSGDSSVSEESPSIDELEEGIQQEDFDLVKQPDDN